MENIALYHHTGIAMGIAGGLIFIQLLVADIAGMREPHTPGAPIKADHNSFIFRSHRTLGNMNESIAVFILFTLVGILSGADPQWLGRFALGYTGARTVYMLCYWFNLQMVRSIFFGLSLLALLGLGLIMTGGLLH